MRSCIFEVRIYYRRAASANRSGHDLSHLVVASMVAVVGFQSAVVSLSIL